LIEAEAAFKCCISNQANHGKYESRRKANSLRKSEGTRQ
jgi:hypothetical protein